MSETKSRIEGLCPYCGRRFVSPKRLVSHLEQCDVKVDQEKKARLIHTL